jgi:hypothetical protein
MADRDPPSTLLERLGAGVFNSHDGKGMGPTLGPGLSPEHQREMVDRAFAEDQAFLPAPEAAGAAGSLGEGAVHETAPEPATDIEAEHEAQSERMLHARAQSGQPCAPDPSRLRMDRGSADTEGL